MWCDNCLLLLPLRAGSIAWAVWIFAYSFGGGIFLFKYGPFLYFNYPEWQIYGGISMAVAFTAFLTMIALSNKSYIWTRVVRLTWVIFLVLSPIRAIVMILEMAKNADEIAWECANGGQIWTAGAAAASSVSTTSTLPGGFCTTGFQSLQTYFIVGLVIDIICQLYMSFLVWRFSKRLEHYASMKGPVFGGYYNA
jgi:hypothetical protein